MTRPRPTAYQWQRARQLMANTRALQQQAVALTARLATTGMSQAALAQARYDRTNFAKVPDNLANLPALIADRSTALAAREAYARMLKTMHDAPPSVAGIKFERLVVDFYKLVPAARPYLIGPMFDLSINGHYPHLDVDQSDPKRGQLVLVSSTGPLDVRLIHERLTAISDWLGASFEITASTVNTVTLTRRTPLPSVIPFNPAWLKQDHLLYGINVQTHAPLHVPLEKMTHTLIAGVPGSGKSVFLHAFLRSCLHSIDSFHHIYAVCGQGVAFERYRGLHPKLTVNNETEHLYNLAAGLQGVMRERSAQLVRDGRDKMADYILVLIDEWGAFNSPESSTKAAKEAHAAFIQHMQHLGKRGRKTGIRLVLVVQEPVERDLATGIRSTLASIVSFRLPLKNHGQELFGEITPPAVPADPRALPIGRAIFHDGATSQRTLFQVPLIEPPARR